MQRFISAIGTVRRDCRSISSRSRRGIRGAKESTPPESRSGCHEMLMPSSRSGTRNPSNSLLQGKTWHCGASRRSLGARGGGGEHGGFVDRIWREALQFVREDVARGRRVARRKWHRFSIERHALELLRRVVLERDLLPPEP